MDIQISVHNTAAEATAWVAHLNTVSGRTWTVATLIGGPNTNVTGNDQTGGTAQNFYYKAAPELWVLVIH